MQRKIQEVVLRAPTSALWAEIGHINAVAVAVAPPGNTTTIFGVDILVGAGLHVAGECIADLNGDERAIMAGLVAALSRSQCDFGKEDVVKWAYEALQPVRKVAVRGEYAPIMDTLTYGSVIIDGAAYYAHDFIYYAPEVTKKMLPAALATLKLAWAIADSCESIAALKRRTTEHLAAVDANHVDIFSRHPYIKVEKCAGFGAECAEMARQLLPSIAPGTIKMLRNGSA